jgi:hypothetical protein
MMAPPVVRRPAKGTEMMRGRQHLHLQLRGWGAHMRWPAVVAGKLSSVGVAATYTSNDVVRSSREEVEEICRRREGSRSRRWRHA